MSLVPSLLQAIVHVDGEALVMHAGDKPYVVSPTGQVDLASRGLALDAVNGIVHQLLPTELQHALDEFGAVQYELPAVNEFPGEHFTIVAARGGDDLWVEIRRRRIPDEDQVPEDFFPPREVAAAAQPYPVYASAGSPHLGAAVEASADSLELDPDAEMFDSSATAGDGSVRDAIAHHAPEAAPDPPPVETFAHAEVHAPAPVEAIAHMEVDPPALAEPIAHVEPVHETAAPDIAARVVSDVVPPSAPQADAWHAGSADAVVDDDLSLPADVFGDAAPIVASVAPASEPLAPPPAYEPPRVTHVSAYEPVPAHAVEHDTPAITPLVAEPEAIAAPSHAAAETDWPDRDEPPSAPAPLSAAPPPTTFIAPPVETIAAHVPEPAAPAAPEPATVREPVAARVSGFAPRPVTSPPVASEAAAHEPIAPEPVAIALPTPAAAPAFTSAPAHLSTLAEPETTYEPAVAAVVLESTEPLAPPERVVAQAVEPEQTPEREIAASTAPREPVTAPAAVYGAPQHERAVVVETARSEPVASADAAQHEPAATTRQAARPVETSPREAAPEYVVVPEPIASREPERVRIVPPPETPAAAATFDPTAPRAPFAVLPPQSAVVLPLSRNPIRPEQQPLPSLGDDPTMSGLDRLLRVSSARGASTLYLSSELRPAVRVDGELQMLEGEPVLAARDVESLLLTLMPERNHEALRTGAATEWICDVEDVGRVRCMSFRDHRGPGGVFRLMPTRSVSADQLGLPRVVQSLAIEPEGLVLVAGPRSSGKRTLMSAFVDLINRTRRDHVITIEREINIVHERGNSFISQREVRGSDEDVIAAARAALREDPDVLMIEDLRTAGLMNVAIEAAASGHLVVGGFAAHSATAAVDRIIDLYAPEHRRQVQFALADSLRGVVVQVLLKKRGGGRVAGREVLLNTPAVSSVIAEGKTSQLPMAIEGGRRYGMVPMNDALVALVQSGAVEAREAYRQSPDRTGFVASLTRHGLDTSFVERLA